jgi:hypothetical protein
MGVETNRIASSTPAALQLQKDSVRTSTSIAPLSFFARFVKERPRRAAAV